MKYIKGYLAMTSAVYCLLVFCVIPLMSAGAYLLIFRHSAMGVLLFAGIVTAYSEVLADYLVFSGMAAKKPAGYGYFLTSRRGLPILEKILLVDDGRRLLWMSVTLTVCFFFGRVLPPMQERSWKTHMVSGCELIASILLLYAIVTTVLFVVRMFEVPTANLLAAYLVALNVVGFGVCFFCIGFLQGGTGLLACVLGGAWALGITIVKNRFTMKQIGGCYYDQKM